MMTFRQLIWAFASSFHFLGLTPFYDIPTPPPSQDSKSIAIIGAGSAGLATLRVFLGLPDEIRQSWNISLYEQCDDVGGIWLPDPRPVTSPNIPYTPLYPRLHTNTPVPSMTYPHFPFPPDTPLYPSHEDIQAYHERYAKHHNMLPHIRFRHTVLSTRWVGNSVEGFWNITVVDHLNRTLQATADHLIVASGNNHIPRIPSWDGQEKWLEYGKNRLFPREILHSVYYRDPERYRNRTLLIIGAGASGQDAGVQTVQYSRRTYISVRHDVELPPGSENVVVKPEVSHFTEDGIKLVDGTELKDVDSVLLATGYEQRKPFLESAGLLTVDPSARSNSSSSSRGGTLVTNLQYIFPLHQHIFSLSPEYPVNALAFIGLPTRIANCPSDFAQGLFAAQTIANPTLLPPRKELLRELVEREEETRRQGLDPYVIGHAMLPTREVSSDYQDDLVEFLKQKKAIPDNGHKYVEEWRRRIFTYEYLKRGWNRIVALGEAESWVKGVETEEQWSDLMYRVNAWQEDWERQNGIRFVKDFVVGG